MPMSAMATELPTGQKNTRFQKDVEITGWRIRVYYWSRDPAILFWTAMAIVGIGILLGHLLEPTEKKDILANLMEKMSQLLPRDIRGSDKRLDLSTEILKAKPDLGRVLQALEFCDTEDEKAVANVSRGLQLANLQAAEKNVAIAYWQSLCSHLDEPGADL